MDASQPSPSPTLVGSFNFDASDNVDEYLKGLGVGLVLRKVHSVSKPHYDIISSNMSQWKIKVKSVFRMKEIAFKPMEKFEDETFDSRKCQTTVEVLENGKVLKWLQVCEEGPDVESVMTATEPGFTLTMKSGEFRSEMRFLRVEVGQQNQVAVAAAENVRAPAQVPDPVLPENDDEDWGDEAAIAAAAADPVVADEEDW